MRNLYFLKNDFLNLNPYKIISLGIKFPINLTLF